MNEQWGLAPGLAALVREYVVNEARFEDVEIYLSAAVDASPDDRELLNSIYHVLNHYDLDESLRAADPAYAARATEALLTLVAALLAGTKEEIRLAVRGCH